MRKKPKNIFSFDLKLSKHKKTILKTSIFICLAFNSFYLLNFKNKIYANDLINSNEKISKESFVSNAVKKTGPSVVTIETQRKVYTRNNSNLPPGLLVDPYFEKLFGFPGQTRLRQRIEMGQGSGVIFNKSGLVITNAHVIDKSEKLIVGLSDGRRVTGEIIGQDSLTDLAVIRLKGKGPWPSCILGDSDKIKVGDWAIAVGNPFGLENTVTLGIISNLNRNVAQLGISDKRISLIQTDAAINPGNSGGPLLNSDGEVIGINTLVRSGPGAGLGFAIPINKAKIIANQIINFGRASHPIIGVSLSSIPLKSGLNNDFSNSITSIRYLVPGGPAEKSGLRVNDFIISVGGRLIKDPSDVVTAISENGTKKGLNFLIKRNNRNINIIVFPIEIHELERSR